VKSCKNIEKSAKTIRFRRKLLELLGGFPPTGINFDSATQLAKTKNHPAGWFPFWSCWADSNRRPHPYQVIKCPPAVAAQGVAGVFAAKRMRSETLCSMCSVRSFPRVGHGVGQRHSQHRCGSIFAGRGMVTFCTAGSSKRTPWKKHRATSGELRSRRAALNFYGKFPVWVKMWVKAFSAHQETAAEHRR